MIAGFEPLDILQAIHMILAQLAEGRCEVENQYKRVVPYEGNQRALEVMAEVFELRPHFEWRGLGFISQSGLKLSDAYADLDAERRFAVPGVRVADPKACQCGEVLKGVIKPWECKVFGTACTPERADRHLHGLAPRAPARPTTTTAASRASGRWSSGPARLRREQRILGDHRDRAREARRSSATSASRWRTAPAARRPQTLIEGLLVPALHGHSRRSATPAPSIDGLGSR